MDSSSNITVNHSLLLDISKALNFIESSLSSDFLKSEMLNFHEAKKFLNVTEPHLRKLVFLKQIPVKRIGRKLMFSKSELSSWLDEKEA